MTGGDVAALCILVLVSTGVAALAVGCAYGSIRSNPGVLYPRGLRWVQRTVLWLGRTTYRTGVRIFYPERRWQLKSRRTEELEALDASWRSALAWSPEEVPFWCPWPNGRGGSWKAPRFMKGEPWDC